MHSHAIQVILSLSLFLTSLERCSILCSTISVGLRTGWLTWVAVSEIYYYCVEGNSVPVLFYSHQQRVKGEKPDLFVGMLLFLRRLISEKRKTEASNPQKTLQHLVLS
jgi:hypothetical protein